jgi:hypothetical protein
MFHRLIGCAHAAIHLRLQAIRRAPEDGRGKGPSSTSA